jgi:hypothetical protein
MPNSEQRHIVKTLTGELEIWRAANLLLRRHGDKAKAEGAARADALSAAGDHEGCRGLAADHPRHRQAHQQNPARTDGVPILYVIIRLSRAAQPFAIARCQLTDWPDAICDAFM